MTTSLLNSSVTGLLSAQIGLQTAQHNISNQNTAGFNRQRIVQGANLPMLTGSGYVGQGAHVSTVERIYDGFLAGQVNRTQSSVSQLETYYGQVAQIDNMLADANAGLTPSLQNFFAAVHQVAANPSQVSARQALLSSSQALVSRYQGIDARLQELYANVNTQLQSQADTVNSYAKQIVELNQSLIRSQSSLGQPANDLLDQRDQLIANLNKLIRVETTTNTDGSLNVFFGTGQQLVVGTQASTLTAAPSTADPSRVAIGLSVGSGIQELPESLLAGGSIAGLLAFRSEALDQTANEVGRNAASFAMVFNAQNALGQDVLGQSKGDANFIADFFKLSPPAVTASSRNSLADQAVVTATLMPPSIDGYYTLSREAAGASYSLTRQSDGQTWSGATLAELQANLPGSEPVTVSGAVVAAGKSTQIAGPAAGEANFYTKLSASDYRLSYDGANYSLQRLADGRTWSDDSLAKLSASVSGSEGFGLSLASGTLAGGDSFLIRPVRDAAKNLSINPAVATDARLVAAGMPIKTASAAGNSGNGKISAGMAGFGYGSPALALTASSGVSLKYDAATQSLSLSGLPAGANISLSGGGTTTVYAGATIPYASGATISFAGVSFSISGNLNDGDAFSLTKNAAGVSDSRNAGLLAKLQTQNTLSGRTASFESSYAQLVSSIGNKTRQISVTCDAQQSLLDQSKAARDATSGVNLDEEAANLIRYQQAYQASAKALQVGTNLFDTLIGVMK